MQIASRLSISADGYVTTPDGWPAQLADPAFTPGQRFVSERALPGGSVEIVYSCM